MTSLTRSPGRALLLLLATAALASTAPAVASADLLTASAEDCDAQRLSRPFLPWADPALYTPLAGGGLEDSTHGWKLIGGARVVAGNEPWGVAGTDDRASLALPGGSQVTTSTICVGLGHPTMRFFVRHSSGSVGSTLGVEVLYTDAAGIRRRLPIGTLAASSWWAPSPPLPVIANLLPLLPDGRSEVAFHFTPQGAGEWRIDDVFVDPWRAR